ncbi:ABC transporter ATP-binding protein [Sphingomonas oleivorans]|uniref:ABC transporter ATP-binding protein n=1 Tax=Sphingomonas oleivorans TaxID=1735121 RepID=A0A2T5G212_9SPHN|nr:ABC transporter ATP-binding protein [Sphingomonas oleivorans]PTQ13185.1 ABC transporter ATP-binding protein [Sphingomonas oleivorans]
MREDVLRLTAVSKSLPGGRRLFEGLDLVLAAGEQVAIRGESGVGKSTLLNIVAGLDAADSGEIMVAGRNLAGLDETERTVIRRDKIGFVFQAFHILPYLDLAQNVAFPLILQKIPRSKAIARAGELLDAVGLGERRRSYPKELSGGELQRVAIARALVHEPALILADEPTGNLDPDTAEQIMALLGRSVKQRGAAMLLVTHSPTAAATADRQLLLTPHGLVPAHG